MGFLDFLGQKKETESPEEFWRRTAEKRGGEIKYYTFAIFLGRSKDSPCDLPGLLYMAGDTLWFEDFEKDAGWMRLFTPKSAYAKTEFGVPASDIRWARPVSRKTAFACIDGRMEPKAAPLITPFAKVFFRSAVEIGLSDGGGLYFEVLKEKELLVLLAGAGSKK